MTCDPWWYVLLKDDTKVRAVEGVLQYPRLRIVISLVSAVSLSRVEKGGKEVLTGWFYPFEAAVFSSC
jgi:hypothetical protein